MAGESRWGGKRAGAGPKRRGPKRVSHRSRPALDPRHPVHVRLGIRPDVGELRRPLCFQAIERALWSGGNKFGLRVAHFAVMSDHLHMILEAEGKESLSSGLHALNVRLARAVNRALVRRGNVFADHYDADALSSAAAVSKVRDYLSGDSVKTARSCELCERD